MWSRGPDRDRDAAPSEADNAANVVADEQLLAANMHPGKDRDPAAALDPRQQLGAVVGAEIGLVLRQRLVDLLARPPFDVADFAEPFSSQQRLGDILRSAADARHL